MQNKTIWLETNTRGKMHHKYVLIHDGSENRVGYIVKYCLTTDTVEVAQPGVRSVVTSNEEDITVCREATYNESGCLHLALMRSNMTIRDVSGIAEAMDIIPIEHKFDIGDKVRIGTSTIDEIDGGDWISYVVTDIFANMHGQDMYSLAPLASNGSDAQTMLIPVAMQERMEPDTWDGIEAPLEDTEPFTQVVVRHGARWCQGLYRSYEDGWYEVYVIEDDIMKSIRVHDCYLLNEDTKKLLK